VGNIIGDDVPDSEDEQSVQGGANNLPPRSLKKTKKAAYNVYFGRTTGVFTQWFVAPLSFILILIS
jgi:hypothetical protein